MESQDESESDEYGALATAQVDRRADLQDSLVVMDIADRLRRRNAQLDQATDVMARRKALRDRLRQLYENQHIAIDDETLDKAIDQRIDQRLTYSPARGLSAWLARFYVRLVGSP